MPKCTEFRFPSSNGQNEIFVRLCEPDGAPRGIVQIAHGVAEHSERYLPFMNFLAEKGFVAAADDHLGHGKSVRDESELGYFAEKDGWECVVKDLHTLHEKLVQDYPDLPVFLFGTDRAHPMATKKAIVLAAGLGTRLRPLTCTTP